MNATAALIRRRRSARGAILIVVLVMIVLTAAMLTTFIEKAGTDLIIESRHVQSRELRRDAYSALEVTLAVLQNFVQANNNQLRSPLEGWGDPLAFAEWEPPEGLEVAVTFEDESGKISLPNVDANTLNAVFQYWEMSEADAQELTDALLSWMRPNYTTTTAFSADYDQGDVPYAPPRRSLLNYNELAAINIASEVFYDEEGLPNELWWKFRNTFSLYNYTLPNINALPVRPELLVALGRFDPSAAETLNNHLAGAGANEGLGPQFFQTIGAAQPVLGVGTLTGFGVQIRALRMNVTVTEGDVQYRLSSLVTFGSNPAQTVQSPATNDPTGASAGTATNPGNAATGRGGAAGGAARGGAGAARGGNAGGGGAAGATGAATTSLQYPFTVLEILENIDPTPQAPAGENPEGESPAPSGP